MTQRLIVELAGNKQEGREGMPRYKMDYVGRLLEYFSRTYRYMKPYL